jgi:hypothetical protein
MRIDIDLDDFENSYRVFKESLEVLAASPEESCNLLGHFNVAFETKLDLESGPYLFNYSSCPFSPVQRETVISLITHLNKIPSEVLAFTKSPQ